MNKILTLPLAALLLVLVLLAPGCKKDKEDDRLQFLATYSVVENCPSFGVNNFDMTITSSATSDNGVIISNFGDFGVSVSGTVSVNTLTVPQQTITANGAALNVSGSGTINGLSLTISYTFSVGSQGESCSMACTKK
jgi:hypothetical protein